METVRGLHRTTSQKSMSPFGRGCIPLCSSQEAAAGDLGDEVFDRQGPAARRLERQESVPANRLVSYYYTFLCAPSSLIHGQCDIQVKKTFAFNHFAKWEIHHNLEVKMSKSLSTFSESCALYLSYRSTMRKEKPKKSWQMHHGEG